MHDGLTSFLALIDALPPEQVVGPTAAAGWTVRDHITHLAVWAAGMAALLRRQDRWASMGVMLLLFALAAGCVQAPQDGGEAPTSAAPSAPEPDGSALTGPSGEALNAARRKIGSALLTALDQRRGAAGASPPLESGVQVDSEGRTVVDITANVSDALLAKLQALGAEVVDSVPQFRTIRARVPLAQLEAVAAEDEVVSIQPAQGATTN